MTLFSCLFVCFVFGSLGGWGGGVVVLSLFCCLLKLFRLWKDNGRMKLVCAFQNGHDQDLFCEMYAQCGLFVCFLVKTPMEVSDRLGVSRRLIEGADGESTQLVAVPNPSSPPSPPDGISLAAWRQRLYRNRLKNDPQKHKLVKAAAANRAKEYRKRQQHSLSPSKKAELRVKANERLRKFREKQKLKGDTAQKKEPATSGATDQQKYKARKFEEKRKLKGDTAQKKEPTTSGAADRRREKARLRQQRYRARLAANKKATIKEQNRNEAAQAKIAVASPAQDLPSESLQETPASYRTSSAKRMAVQKATLSVPDSPTLYTTVCQGLQSTESPCKISSFGDIGDSCPVS